MKSLCKILTFLLFYILFNSQSAYQYEGLCLQLHLHKEKSKVNYTLVQALRFCTGRTAQRGSRGVALLFLDHRTEREWGVRVTTWPLFTPGIDSVPVVQEAGWVLGPVWTGAENLASTGIRSPDSPACSQSLYWLRYPALLYLHRENLNLIWIALFAFVLHSSVCM